MPQPVFTSFDDFTREARARGFDEIVEREWAPGTVLEAHTHPFTVWAQGVRDESWLTCGSQSKHLERDDPSDLDAHVPHGERYGVEGAAYGVARRQAA
jgi:hypothetical protein